MTREEILHASGEGMFAVIPAVVMRDTCLPMSARMLYGLLTWKSGREGRCWPTNRVLAGELGLSQNRVSALLSLLEERGHIETKVLRDAQTGQVVRRYIYPLMKSGEGIPEHEDTSPRDCADPPPEIEEVYKEKQKEETKKNPPKAPKGGRRDRYQLTEEARDMLRAYVAGDRALAETMAAFMEIRQAKRAVNSARSVRMLLAELERLSGGEREVKLALLRQSTVNAWKGIFPLRGGPPGPETPRRTVENEKVPSW